MASVAVRSKSVILFLFINCLTFFLPFCVFLVMGLCFVVEFSVSFQAMSCVSLWYMGLVVTKPVFGVSDKASFKSVSSATGTS